VVYAFEEGFVNVKALFSLLKRTLFTNIPADYDDGLVHQLRLCTFRLLSEENLYIFVNDLGGRYLDRLFFWDSLAHI
jgi:hypothetical protein